MKLAKDAPQVLAPFRALWRIEKHLRRLSGVPFSGLQML
jgi:hypothetical protein